MRRDAKPTKAKVESKLPAPPKSRKSESSRARDLEERLAETLKREAEALEQHAATAEILRAISRTQTALGPIFDTIVEKAGRVCDSVDTVLVLADGDNAVVAAHSGPIGGGARIAGMRFPLSRGQVMGRAIIDAQPVHVDDLSTRPDFPEGQALALQWGHRTTLAVPLLRDGRAIGSLLVRRTEVRPFSDKHIALLQTFADQAVIAIENVRLFKELQEKNKALTEAHAQVSESLESSRRRRARSSAPSAAHRRMCSLSSMP